MTATEATSLTWIATGNRLLAVLLCVGLFTVLLWLPHSMAAGIYEYMSQEAEAAASLTA